MPSRNEEINTGDYDILLTENNHISSEAPKDDNHEEIKSRSHASSKDIPPDPKNESVKYFHQKRDDKTEVQLGESECIIKKKDSVVHRHDVRNS